MKTHHIGRDGEDLGKFTADEIQEGLKTGQFKLEDWIFNKESNDWVALKEVNFRPVNPTALPPPFKSKVLLWNPNSAVNWSLLFGPLFGQVLHYLNWRNLNEQERAINALIWAGFGLIVPFAWLFFVPLVALIAPTSTPSLTLLVVVYQLGLLIVWAFSYGGSQTRFVKRKFGKDYVRQKWGKPLLIGLGYAVLLMGVGAFQESLFVGAVGGEAVNAPKAEAIQTNEGEATNAPQTQRQTEDGVISESTPKPIAQAKRFATIIGDLPSSFSAGENIEYTIQGLFLTQNAEGFWLTDLLPATVVKNFPKSATYPSGQKAATFQILLNQMIRSKLYKPGLQLVILIPRDKAAYDRINLPAQQTILTVKGEFVKYHTIEMVSGAGARLPVFIIDSIKLWDGEYFDLKEQ